MSLMTSLWRNFSVDVIANRIKVFFKFMFPKFIEESTGADRAVDSVRCTEIMCTLHVSLDDVC